MAIDLHAVVVEADEPVRLARFWADLLEAEASNIGGEESVAVQLEDGVVLEFVPATQSKEGKNRLHLDLASESEGHQTTLVEAACRLGGALADIGQDSVPWVVLADPEGNEFCVLEPRDEYRGCGPVAAVVTDTHDPVAVARFLSDNLGFPMTRAHPDYASLRRDGGSWLEFVRNPHRPQRQGRLHLQFAAQSPPPGQAATDCPVCPHQATAASDPESTLFCISPG
ncbi:VOC family protein [Mycolicibacterium litorale]|uniref:Glyoxalase-like domain-containing protein n=1 Tax=Mycolicibacterium litorale TaxID=758802 RepID=A0AAD1MVD7_9MYCO|nr:VOC family protein [Mycolicibacterium litorale]MCV7417434.1 VOC family protein [Mycolicibacterium litorale]TDY05223.1 hypothetical protein BCL50_4013 [Mycolicibacterium litorale]BBY18660.1 hypothetical protein MLIT_42520 [Mycolicibacterium litorale]